MKEVKLITEGFGKKARRQIKGLLPEATTFRKTQAGMYVIKDALGKIIASVEARSTCWATTLNNGDRAILYIK